MMPTIMAIWGIIKHPNVTLDCDYARLTGQGDGIGIYIKRSDNVIVKNCIIDNYEFGIYAEDSDNIQVRGMGNRMYNTSEMLVLDNSTALPPPDQAPQQKITSGLINSDRQALMGQKLQVKRVPSQVGDSLKMKARPGALATSSESSTSTRTAVRTPASREAKLRAEREARMAERKSKRLARAAATTEPKRVVRPRPERLRAAAAPLITFPKSGQRFTAPARVTVKARYDKKRKVVYLLKQLPGKRIVKKSTRATFSKLSAGSYCVAAAYTGRGGATSACIEFRVVKPKRITAPVRRPAPLRRP
jgi:parallel beta-helix repeat protein